MSGNNDTSIRTPLGRARGSGSARDGVGHWWWQRVSAVALLPLCIYFIWNAPFFLPPVHDYPNLIVTLANPIMSLALIFGILAGFYHAAVGVQVIIEDYVHGENLKIVMLLLNKIAFAALGITALYAVIYISFALFGQTPLM
ncbi:MAG: succinate dehydrogenase, hydrophobic membrane anchor protein [Alphaproteobacteria bacterium]|nr:succinate dehydrogenase, hydrophobic membrane anchor protein [Alphaproteobacteria bacterium]